MRAAPHRQQAYRHSPDRLEQLDPETGGHAFDKASQRHMEHTLIDSHDTPSRKDLCIQYVNSETPRQTLFYVFESAGHGRARRHAVGRSGETALREQEQARGHAVRLNGRPAPRPRYRIRISVPPVKTTRA